MDYKMIKRILVTSILIFNASNSVHAETKLQADGKSKKEVSESKNEVSEEEKDAYLDGLKRAYINLGARNPKNKKELKPSFYYIIKGLTGNLTSIDTNECQFNEAIKSNTENEINKNKKCFMPYNSIYQLLSIDEKRNTAVITINEITKIEGDIKVDGKIARKGFIYKHADADALAVRSYRLDNPGERFSLRGILIPQKFYTSTNDYSSNPTIGIGFSVLGSIGFSLTFGAGFNQLTIDTTDGADEKTGFSYYVGWDFADFKNDLAAGLYYGVDIVGLKDGQTFNGENDESQKWFGLVLSAGF